MTESKCQICQANVGKYSCPRCNIFYCSVSCYQSADHVECSETFYQSCVKEELASREINPEVKKKMLEILKESYQSTSDEESLDSDDEENESDLASRMLDLNFDDADSIWEKLTPVEKAEFRKLVATGEIIKIVPNWEPWWIIMKKKMLIQECGSEQPDCEQICPKLMSPVPLLSTLTKVPPSPKVSHMLLNILASYACTVRWFKGTHLEMPIESVSTCIALSATLRSNQVFSNSVEAFMSFENDYLKCEWLRDTNFNASLINEDLKDISRGQLQGDMFYSLKAALSDMHEITSEAIQNLKQSKTLHLKRFTGECPKLEQLHLIRRKMIYYLAWTIEHGTLLTNSLSSFVG